MSDIEKYLRKSTDPKVIAALAILDDIRAAFAEHRAVVDGDA